MEHNKRGGPGVGDYNPIRLTSDFVFKYVFGSETSTGILRSFLSAVQTDAGLPAVAEVEIRNPFNPAESYDDKTSVVDVRARDINGTVYTVEVQALPETASLHTTFRLTPRQSDSTDDKDQNSRRGASHWASIPVRVNWRSLAVDSCQFTGS